MERKTKNKGIIYFKYLRFSLISIAVVKGTTVNEAERCETLALINSKLPSFCYKLSFNCKVFNKRSEIEGKKLPMILDA